MAGCSGKSSSVIEKGICSTRRTTSSPSDDPDRFKKAVHLDDIHLEKGMHCVDCHFRQDAHGNGILYNEPRAAIEIGCIDCHGTIRERAKLVTSGFAAGTSIKDGKIVDGQGRNLATLRFRTPDGGRVLLFQKINSDTKKKTRTATKFN
jgi:hypothetical protein